MTQQYETNVVSNKKKRTLHHIGFAVYEVPQNILIFIFYVLICLILKVPPNMTRLSPQYVLEHVSATRKKLVVLGQPLLLSGVALSVLFHWFFEKGSKCTII